MEWGQKVLMKIDAEGAEPEIIEGMGEFLAGNEVTVILEWDARRWPGVVGSGEVLAGRAGLGSEKITKALRFARVLEGINGGRPLTLVNQHGEEEARTAEWLAGCREMLMVVVRSGGKKA